MLNGFRLAAVYQFVVTSVIFVLFFDHFVWSDIVMAIKPLKDIEYISIQDISFLEENIRIIVSKTAALSALYTLALTSLYWRYIAKLPTISRHLL